MCSNACSDLCRARFEQQLFRRISHHFEWPENSWCPLWSDLPSPTTAKHTKNIKNWNTRTLRDQITAEDFSDHRVPSTLYLESSSTSCGANMWLRSRRLSKYSERRPFSWRLRLSSKSSTQDKTLRKPTLQQQPGSFKIINRQVQTAYTQITAYFGKKKNPTKMYFCHSFFFLPFKGLEAGGQLVELCFLLVLHSIMEELTDSVHLLVAEVTTGAEVER